MSGFVRAKAGRLLCDGRVTICCLDGELVASVRGDTGVYTVALDRRGRAFCDCPSWRRVCSHALAVSLVLGGCR